jgi:hypothetical protein
MQLCATRRRMEQTSTNSWGPTAHAAKAGCGSPHDRLRVKRLLGPWMPPRCQQSTLVELRVVSTRLLLHLLGQQQYH